MHGSSETIMKVMTQREGTAAIVQNVENNLSVEMNKQAMSKTTGAAVSWDEASYGGLTVNIGFAVDTDTLLAADFKPTV